MPVDALALALAAAVIHAGWNLLVADAEDPEMVAPLALAVGACVLAPLGVAFWDVDAAAWPYIGASVVFELAYFALLARAYARAELGFVYPIARGSAPVVVLLVTASFALADVGGVLLVCAGIVLVRGIAGSGELLLALGVGACIAGYTVVDDHGVRHAGEIAYLTAVMVPTALIWLAFTRPRRKVTPRIAGAGVGMVAAYLLTLLALDRAAAAPVAAVRETSVLFAVAFAALVARERVTPARAAGAALIVAGVAVLA
jgi:drug/metabolite transporter (DMT)-like permease